MARAYHFRYGLDYVGLRYMNVYGPRQDYRGAYIAVIMKMLDAIDKGQGPTILGDVGPLSNFRSSGSLREVGFLPQPDRLRSPLDAVSRSAFPAPAAASVVAGAPVAARPGLRSPLQRQTYRRGLVGRGLVGCSRRGSDRGADLSSSANLI